MAKTHPQHSKPRSSSLFLCCFGSFSPHASIENAPLSDHDPKQKRRRWFSWRKIRIKNSDIKTVPLESSLSDHKPKRRANKAHSSKSKSKPHKPSVSSHSPATNSLPPRLTPPVFPVVSNETPPQTRHGHGHRQEQNLEEHTRQQSRGSPSRCTLAMSDSASLPTTKRQVRTLSSKSMQPQTTLKQSKRQENPKGYDPVVGMSVVMVTLLVMVLWGRLCAILCTSAWLYTIPRFRKNAENDGKNLDANSNDLDLDSKDYKKKVILEGLLERNHRGTP